MVERYELEVQETLIILIGQCGPGVERESYPRCLPQWWDILTFSIFGKFLD